MNENTPNPQNASPTASAAPSVPPAQGVAASYFDGKTARRIDARLQMTTRTLAVLTADGEPIAHVPKDVLRISERIANTPYRIEFPDGALAVTSDHAAIERSFKLNPGAHWLAKLERAPWAIAVAIAGLFAALYYAYTLVIPQVASAVAERIPREAEKSLGDTTMKSLDGFMFSRSELSDDQKAPIRKTFDALARESGLNDQVTLEFRKMSPNALAIPGGTIVVTDGLVKVFKGDERLIGAVLAHELGHIHYRHSLKHLLEGSASALIVGALAGDVSGVSALVTSAPIILSALAYTRDSEREADRYAFDLLKKSGRSPMDFADAMRRFQVMEDCIRLKSADRNRSSSNPFLGRSENEDESPDGEEEEGDSEPKTGADAKTASDTQPESRSAARGQCLSDPDSVVKGREAEARKLRDEEGDRETGYMHTHPVTEERIRAAEAAAK